MNNPPIRFDGQAVLVTGAGRGLGRAQALLLASRGARVVVADNGTTMAGQGPDRGPASALVAEIVASGGEAVACTADLATEAGAGAAVQDTLDAFGRIDAIVHYASTCPELSPPDQLRDTDLDLVMRINPFAAVWMARAAWPQLVRQGYGRLVFMPSAAIYGALGNTLYAAAKSSYLGITRCLALEGREHGIRVNSVMPAANTRMTGGFQPSAFTDWFRANFTPDKVAAAVAFLLSDACEVSGEVFAVGGGRIARVALAENEGVTGACNSVEDAGAALDEVMRDASFFHPADLGQRIRRVNALLGFDAAKGPGGKAP